MVRGWIQKTKTVKVTLRQNFWEMATNKADILPLLQQVIIHPKSSSIINTPADKLGTADQPYEQDRIQ